MFVLSHYGDWMIQLVSPITDIGGNILCDFMQGLFSLLTAQHLQYPGQRAPCISLALSNSVSCSPIARIQYLCC